MNQLQEYAQHKYDCEKWWKANDGTPMFMLRGEAPCTCGLSALLAQEEQQREPLYRGHHAAGLS